LSFECWTGRVNQSERWYSPRLHRCWDVGRERCCYYVGLKVTVASWYKRDPLLAAQNPLLSVQEIKASIDHLNLTVGKFRCSSCLSALRFQCLLFELADNLV
jgi:hypothetical protein